MAFQTMSGIPKVTSTANFYSNTNPLLQSRGIGGFAEPLSLFGAGEQGAWWDFSDLTVMFQDSAGTVPAALESPVGKILDKSGKNNHLIQATAGARPTLSRKYNIFTESEFRNGITDAPTRGGLVTAASINGFAGAVAFGYDGATSTFAYKAQQVTIGLQYKLSVIVQMDNGGAPVFPTGGDPTNVLNDFALVVGNAAVVPSVYTVEPAGIGLYKVSCTVAAFATSSNNGVIKYNTNSSRTFKVTAYDIRLASDAALAIPQYQRTQTTDYDTLGFPAYLLFDGATKWMQSASAIPFSGTTLTSIIGQSTLVAPGAACSLYEHSTSNIVNDGTFNLYKVSGPANTVPGLRGTVSQESINAPPTTPPQTSVISVSIDSTQATPVARQLVYENNAQLVTASRSGATTAGPFTSQTFYVASRAGGSDFYNGRMYGLILRNALTNDNDLQMTNKWMGSKCGLFF